MNQRPISISLQTSFCPFFKVHLPFHPPLNRSTFITQKQHQLQACFYATNYITDRVIRIPQVSQNVALNWAVMTLCQNACSKWIELLPVVIYMVKACSPHPLYSMSNACAASVCTLTMVSACASSCNPMWSKRSTTAVVMAAPITTVSALPLPPPQPPPPPSPSPSASCSTSAVVVASSLSGSAWSQSPADLCPGRRAAEYKREFILLLRVGMIRTSHQLSIQKHCTLHEYDCWCGLDTAVSSAGKVWTQRDDHGSVFSRKGLDTNRWPWQSSAGQVWTQTDDHGSVFNQSNGPKLTKKCKILKKKIWDYPNCNQWTHCKWYDFKHILET